MTTFRIPRVQSYYNCTFALRFPLDGAYSSSLESYYKFCSMGINYSHHACFDSTMIPPLINCVSYFLERRKPPAVSSRIRALGIVPEEVHSRFRNFCQRRTSLVPDRDGQTRPTVLAHLELQLRVRFDRGRGVERQLRSQELQHHDVHLPLLRQRSRAI